MHSQRLLPSLPALAFVVATMPGATLAADNPGSHQHGHADLQIAIDGEHIDVFLLSPAANLVGFEQAPTNDQQRQAVAGLTAWASQTPLINTLAGSCTVNSADVHATWPKNDDHNHGHEHGHDHHSGHADFEISQALACPGLAAGAELETGLMARFAAVEQIDVQWVSPQGQGGSRLTPEQSRFRLSR